MYIDEMATNILNNIEQNQDYILTVKVRKVYDPTVSGIATQLEVDEYNLAIVEV